MERNRSRRWVKKPKGDAPRHAKSTAAWERMPQHAATCPDQSGPLLCSNPSLGGSDYARGGVAPGVCGPSRESGCRDDVPRSHASPERCALSFTLSDCCNWPRASRRDTPRSTAFSSPSPAACGLLAAHRQEHTTQEFSRVPPANNSSSPQRCGHEPFYPSLVRI